MTLRVPGCLGDYDFEHIVHFAKKRFIEGCDTITLLKAAHTEREKEEIILVSLLDVDEDQILSVETDCPHACDCQVQNCRQQLKRMLQESLNAHTGSPSLQNTLQNTGQNNK